MLAPDTSRQRLAATFLIWKAPLFASAVMFHSCSGLLSQSWTSIRVAFTLALPFGPKHLLVFALSAIFQLALPSGW